MCLQPMSKGGEAGLGIAEIDAEDMTKRFVLVLGVLW